MVDFDLSKLNDIFSKMHPTEIRKHLRRYAFVYGVGAMILTWFIYKIGIVYSVAVGFGVAGLLYLQMSEPTYLLHDDKTLKRAR